MNELACLVGRPFLSLARREHDWLASFDEHASLVIACLWRLVESDRIRFTSEDDGQHFGLSESVDVAAEVNRRLGGAVVVAVEIREGILDLELRFSTGQALQVIPDSSGYEAWNISCGSRQFIAVGGGELAVVDSANDVTTG